MTKSCDSVNKGFLQLKKTLLNLRMWKKCNFLVSFFVIFFFCDKINMLILDKGRKIMQHEYVFKMKKGDIEIELKSDDIEFVEQQLNKWREDIMQKG